MRLAILSDIHANLPALEAVLAAIDERRRRRDLVPRRRRRLRRPARRVRALVAERCELSLVGNHDLAVLGELDITSFSPAAAAAVRWTQLNAADETLEFLRGLEPADDEPRGRPLSRLAARPRLGVRALARPGGRMHRAPGRRGSASSATRTWRSSSSSGQRRRPARGRAGGRSPAAPRPSDGTELDLAEGRWLINPGSVGQPRDGDPRAAWLELDTDAWTATYHRVEYDIDRAAEAIDEPPSLPSTSPASLRWPMTVRLRVD